MIRTYLKKTPFFMIFLMMLLMLSITAKARALDVTAKSSSHTDVQNAANQVGSAGGGIVYIPAGDSVWTDDVNVSGPVSFIGQGYDKTIIRRNSGGSIFTHKQAGSWVRYSGIGFYGTQVKGTTMAIYLSQAQNFRIHNCKFYASRWHGVITFKRCVKGLIDHNVFNRLTEGTSNYGIQLGSNYVNKPAICDYNDRSCYNTWETWWDNPDTNSGMVFQEDFPAGTDQMIYIEDNTFDWYGPAVEGNWGSKHAVSFRYNTVRTHRNGSSSFAIKPGAQWAEVYNNTFTCVTGDCDQNPQGKGTYFRVSGLYYNNTLTNYKRGGEFAAYYCAYGYCYTEQVVMDETYIYDNTYVNVDCSGDNGTCWREWSEGAPERIAENQNYFFRAPQAGDKIYPYTPYTYPHPLSSNNPKPPPIGDHTPPEPPGELRILGYLDSKNGIS